MKMIKKKCVRDYVLNIVPQIQLGVIVKIIQMCPLITDT